MRLGWPSYLVLLFCYPGQAQINPVAPPRPTLIQEDVNEVTLDITVRDKHRRPVRDLTADEVRITDDGKPVVLKSFRLASANAESKDLRTVTILLEGNQAESGRAAYEATSALLKDLAPSKTYYSAWQINDRLTRISDFTADAAMFQDAMRTATTATKGRGKPERRQSVSAPASDPLPAALQGVFDGTPESAVNMAAQRHIRPWVACLSALVSAEAKISGRKLIVFFSMGVPTQEGTNDALRSLISDANRSGTSIYVVDVSGLSTKATAEAAASVSVVEFRSASLASQTAAGYKPPIPTGPDRTINAPMRDGQFDSVDAHPDFQRNDPLRKLANDTGGTYVSESGNLRESMSEIAEDVQSYYEAVYVPAGEPLDGHFRPVSLVVERPHVVARARSGYYWMPTADGFRVAGFEIPLIKALDGDAHENSIPLQAQVLRFGNQGPNTTVALTVQFPFKGLEAQQDANEKLMNFRFAVVALIRGRDGKVVQKLSEETPYETATERKRETESQVYTFQRHFQLPAGEYWAELAVEDENAKTISTDLVPFTIEAAPAKLHLSDIALVRAVSAASRQPAPGDPLRYGDEQITVEAASKIKDAAQRKLPFFITVYPDSGNADIPRLEIELHRGTQTILKFKTTVESRQSNRAESFLASLPEDRLSSGHYVLIARATQGAVSDERRREFDYEGGGITANGEEASHALVTPLPKLMASVQRPSDGEISAMLSGTRTRAMDFQSGLPNLLCFLRTTRFNDRTGQEHWKERDTITEIVRYAAGREQYSTVEVNGERVSADRSQIGGVQVNGVFGQLLQAVFSERADAVFKWQGKADVDGAPVHVFAYSVPQARSMYDLRSEDGTRAATVGFHGLVYIDPNTLAVRHVSLEADGIPKDFGWKQSIIAVDYDYVTVGEQKYLLPLSATLRVRLGKKILYKNEMAFREYRRFAAESRVLP